MSIIWSISIEVMELEKKNPLFRFKNEIFLSLVVILPVFILTISLGGYDLKSSINSIKEEGKINELRPLRILSPEIESSCVAYWKFDEGTGSTVADSSQYEHNGTITGATWTSGKIGNALEFDGSGDYVNIPHTTDLNLDQITMEGWIYPTYIPATGFLHIIKKGDQGSTISTNYRLCIHDKLLSLGVGDGSSWYGYYESVTELITNKWYHVAVIYNGYNASIYLNGVRDNFYQSSTQHIPVNRTEDLRIGDNYGMEYYQGKLDEMAVYNRVLTEVEIINRYTISPEVDPSCVAYWKFDEGTGSTLIDSSQYGHNGTITGAIWVSGRIGNALEFDGSEDYVNVPHTTDLNLDQITMEGWIYPTYIPATGFLHIIKKGDQGSTINTNYRLCIHDKLLSLGVGDGASWYGYYESVTELTTNKWYHVAVTYDGYNASIYLNGVRDNHYISATQHIPVNRTEALRIGDNYAMEYYQGKIDEMTIYNRELTKAEILGRYSVTPDSDPSCVAYWKFDEGTGSTLADSSQYEHNGTITGATWVNGKIGNALEFDGSEDYVNVPHTTDLNLDQITIEGWIYPTYIPATGFLHIIKKGAQGTTINTNYRLCIHDKLLSLGVGDGASWYGYYESATELTTNKWYHVAVTYDGYNASIYLNGVRNNNYTSSTQHIPVNQTEALRIGDNYGIEYYQGKIDEMAIYNRELSETEVIKRYSFHISTPTIPRNLQSISGDSFVSLIWSAPADNGGSSINEYRIYRRTSSSSFSFLISTPNLNYNDTSVNNGETYYYVVTALNLAGESQNSDEVLGNPQAAIEEFQKALFSITIIYVGTLILCSFLTKRKRIR